MTGFTLFDSQIVAAYAMQSGKIAQLPTGEGKTLAAVLVAAASALQGRHVHILQSTIIWQYGITRQAVRFSAAAVLPAAVLSRGPAYQIRKKHTKAKFSISQQSKQALTTFEIFSVWIAVTI